MNGLRLAAAITGVVGLLSLLVGFYVLNNRLAMVRSWRPVSAQVVSSTMESKSDVDTDSIHYTGVYDLSYVVDGTPMRKTVRADIGDTGYDAAKVRVARHAPGTRGIIHLNPNDPGDVRLNLAINGSTLGMPLWFFVAGGSLLLFALSFWLMGWPGPVW